MLGRSFMQDNDPAPTVATVKSTTKIYPYTPGGAGTSVGTLLTGTVPFAAPAEVPATTFVEGTGTAFNTIPPTDARFFETVHALLQDEPADSGDPEIVGHLAELGIVKGKPFAPDDRMRKILEDAATVGNATSRALMFDSRGEEDVYLVPGLGVDQHAVQRRLPVRDARSRRSRRRASSRTRPPAPASTTCARCSSTATPGSLRPWPCASPGIGSQYLVAFMDSNKAYFDGAKTYTRHVAAGHPRGPVLVAHALRQPDPVDCSRRRNASPGPGSQSYPTPAAVGEPGRLDHRPPRPRAARRRSRRQLDPDGARQGMVHRPAALQPAGAVLRQVLARRRDRARR